jgi:hypothetical protein
MVAQLSTTQTETQPTILRTVFITVLLALLIQLLCVAQTSAQSSSWQQPTEVEVRIEPLSAIDQQFMTEQRSRVETLANRLGRRLSGNAERDLDTLQTIIDRDLVSREDPLSLQALGVVFGDLLARELNMHWIVYRDRAGRSRALQYRNDAIYLFPVTMISRRVEAQSARPVADLYRATVTETLSQLPGARWR